MRDVAAAAGVSVQTVSNLVNGRTNQMTPETQTRLRAVMEQLGYHRNSAARGLRSARSQTIGFLILDESTRFLADPMTDLFMSGLGDVLRDQDYALLIQASRSDRPIDQLLAPLHEGRVDGAVVFLWARPRRGPGTCSSCASWRFRCCFCRSTNCSSPTFRSSRPMISAVRGIFVVTCSRPGIGGSRSSRRAIAGRRSRRATAVTSRPMWRPNSRSIRR